LGSQEDRRGGLNSKKALALTGVLGVSMVGCRVTETNPVRYSVTFPEAQEVALELELSKRLGLGLGGEFEFPGYGSLVLEPESAAHGFRMGLNLDLSVFLRESWVGFQEVSALPTGVSFSSWVKTSLVSIEVPEATTPEVKWNLLVGTRGQMVVGAVAQFAAIGAGFPSLAIDYAFYDDQGRMILGLQFFGPARDGQGRVTEAGGFFVGTDLTAFIPEERRDRLPSEPEIGRVQLALSATTGAGARAKRAPEARGQSLYSEISLDGRDASKVRSVDDLKRVIRKFNRISREKR